MQLPLTIISDKGEKLTFLRYGTDDKGRKIVEVENEVKPQQGPPMHVHYHQDECFTVVKGRLGYQLLGQQEKYATAGDTVLFEAGVPHKFWNAGTDVLYCKGWISQPTTLMYFLSEIYKSMNANNGRPGMFDAAYLLHRYRKEYYMHDIPAFVQKVISPIVRKLGVLQGKHKKFADAPPAGVA